MNYKPEMQAEEAALSAGRARTASTARSVACAWNHAEFCVSYPSLARELCVGDIYIKLLLEGLDQVDLPACCACPYAVATRVHRHCLRMPGKGPETALP